MYCSYTLHNCLVLKPKITLICFNSLCHSLSFVVPLVVIRCHSLLLVIIHCHSLSFVVTRCHSLHYSLSLVVHSFSFIVPLVVICCHLLSFIVPLIVIRCHSLSFVVTCCTTRCTTLLPFYRYFRSLFLNLCRTGIVFYLDIKNGYL